MKHTPLTILPPARRLGIPESPKNGGTQKKETIYLAFPGTGNQRPRPVNDIETIASQAFEERGGLDRLTSLLGGIHA